MLSADFRILGQHGLGATQGAVNAQLRPEIYAQYHENTLPPLLEAMLKVDGVVMPLAVSRDGTPYICNGVRVGLHLARPDYSLYLHEMYDSQIDQLCLKRGTNDAEPAPLTVPTLVSTLSLFKAFGLAAKKKVVIELKGLQDTGLPKPDYMPLGAFAATEARSIGYPLEQLIFASRSVLELADLQAIEPRAKLALITECEAREGGSAYQRLYAPRRSPPSFVQQRYPQDEALEIALPLEKKNIEHAQYMLKGGLAAVYAEATTISGNLPLLRQLAGQGVSLGLWCAREGAARQMLTAATAAKQIYAGSGLPIDILTHYPLQMRATLRTPALLLPPPQA